MMIESVNNFATPCTKYSAGVQCNTLRCSVTSIQQFSVRIVVAVCASTILLMYATVMYS